jgi:SAM-dependent methyltransferase
MEDPKNRFTNRVSDYKKYRPSYPNEALQFIKDKCQIKRDWNIADIGSGTGISTKAMLDAFECTVYAVEPNEKMRLEAENSLSINPLFHSVNGSSDDTKLDSQSINMIAAFQAYHWFDKQKAKEEFKRILKNPKWVLLVWNNRVTEGTQFLEGYEQILSKLAEYPKVNHKNTDINDIKDFIGTSDLIYKEVQNSQRFDYEGLVGRFFSSSYTPSVGSTEYFEQIRKLKELFDATNEGGQIEFRYRTQIYLGMFA